MARTEISTLGEFGLIKHLSKDITPKNDSTEKGIGDDCAVLHYPDSQVLVTSDMLLEGVHFDLTYGARNAAVSFILSDIVRNYLVKLIFFSEKKLHFYGKCVNPRLLFFVPKLFERLQTRSVLFGSYYCRVGRGNKCFETLQIFF